MKKLLVACTMLGTIFCSGAAFADVNVEQILVRQTAATPEGTNIRVDLANNGPELENVASVDLQAREDGNSEWKTIKTWDRPITLDVSNRVALDFLPASEGFLDPILTSSQFQLRAIVTQADGNVVTSTDSYIPLDAASR